MSTKFALALVAALGAASAASANVSYFGLEGEQERDTRIELDLVRSAAPATVEIYDTHTGDLLGSTDVRAGANTDVYVHLDVRPVSHDVLAVLTANGQVLAEDTIDIEKF